MVEQMIAEMYRKGEFREFPWIVRQYKPMEIHNITSLKNAISDQYGLLTKPKIDGKDPKEYVADKITELNTNQQDKEPISKALESPAKHQEVSELNKSEKTEPSIPKPAILKRIINKLTFGLAFSSEINEYKAKQKLQKVQDKKSEITSNSQEPTPISKDKAKFVKKTITPGIKQSAIVIASKVQRTRETQPAIQPTVKKSNDRTR